MSKNAAHGSRTLVDLTFEERTGLVANLDKHEAHDNLKLAKNMATKYGLTQEEVLAIISRRRRAQK